MPRVEGRGSGRRGRPDRGGNGGRRRPLEVAVETARGQQGVVSRGQLREAGLSDRIIDRLLSGGGLRRLYRGVFQVGPVAGAGAREMAALLACGRGSVISHFSAAALWGILPAQRSDQPVHVTIEGRDPARKPGIATHRVRSLDPGHVTVLGGLTLTRLHRTISDLAGRLPARDLERAVARAEREGRLKRDDLLSLLQQHPRRPGHPVLAALLAAGEPLPFTRSEAEERFLELLRDAGLPMPRVNTRVRGFEVDFHWPTARVIVEIDGYAYHSSRAAFEADRHRDAVLGNAGYRVIRVTWTELTTRPERVITLVAQALVTR